MVTTEHRYDYSENIIELFQNGEYEKHILSIMNKSTNIFPSEYKYVDNQSNGECDFIDIKTNEKYDAKLPFTSNQVKLLVNGKKSAPKVKEWLDILLKESSEFFYEMSVNGSRYDISNTKLCTIIKNMIEKDKIDENIIFFLPFPIVDSFEGSIYLQFATDYLAAIYGEVEGILRGREVFAIYPSDKKNHFAVRNIGSYAVEFIEYTGMERYFSHRISSISF